MNDIRFFRIAGRIVDGFVTRFAGNDDYEYVHDPEHKNRPKGSGWKKTKDGWSKGKKDKKSLHSPEKSALSVTVGEHQKSFVGNFYKDGKFNAESFVSSLGEFNSARNEIDSEYEDVSDVESLVHSYSGSGYGHGGPAKKLSVLASYAFDMPNGDYHTDYEKGKKPSEKKIGEFKRYIEKEQKVLKTAGLVTDDGKVRLYRNVGKSLFKYHDDGITIDNYSEHYGASFEYRGAHIESWTFNPDLSWPGAKIYAEVPLESVIASYVGRDGKMNGFSFQYGGGECECMVVASLVKEVTLVGSDGNCVAPFKKKYYSDISSDMGNDVSAYENHVNPKSKEDIEAFAKLVKSKNPKNRIKAVSSPMFNSKYAEQLSKDPNEDVRAAVAASPKISLDLVKEFASDKSPKVVYSVLDNPNLNYYDCEKISESGNAKVSEKAKKRMDGIVSEYMGKVSNSGGFSSSNESLAKNPGTPPQVLVKLADGDSYGYVKKNVAENPHCPADLLEKLSKDNVHVQKAVAENPNVTPEMLDYIAKDNVEKDNNASTKVIISIVNNDKTKPETIDDIYDKSKNMYVKGDAAKNKNMSQDLLKSIYDSEMKKLNLSSEMSYLLSGVLSNVNLPSECIDDFILNDNYHHSYKEKMVDFNNISVNALKSISNDGWISQETKDKAKAKMDAMLKQTSDAISDEEVTQDDIEYLKENFPESCKGKSVAELVILFKTLAKRGYFSNGGGSSDEGREERMSDEDKEAIDYLSKYM